MVWGITVSDMIFHIANEALYSFWLLYLVFGPLLTYRFICSSVDSCYVLKKLSLFPYTF